MDLPNIVLDRMEKEIEKLSQFPSWEDGGSLRQGILDCRQKRIGHYNISSELCTAACVLDPRVNLRPYTSIQHEGITQQVLGSFWNTNNPKSWKLTPPYLWNLQLTMTCLVDL